MVQMGWRIASQGVFEAKVVIFTAFADVDLAVQAFDAGAYGFVLKGAPVEEIYDAIMVASHGETFVSPGFSQEVSAALRKRTQ